MKDTRVKFFVIGLEINFQESDYAIEEGGTLSTDIRLQFRNNQSPFTIRLCPIDINTAEDMGLGFFVDSGDIDNISRATSGKRLHRHTLCI